jgi:hypothetical protein
LISNLEIGQISLEKLIKRREWNKVEYICHENY